MSISIPFQPLFRRKKNSRQQATSTGSTSGKERHGGVTTDIFVDDSMWQAVPWKFWVQRLIFGDVAWFNKYHLKRRWSTYRQMSELLPFGGGCSNLFRARGGDLRSLAYGQRPVQFSKRPTWFKWSYRPLLAYFCNRLNKTHNYNVDSSTCWGGLFKLVPGLRSSLGVRITRATTCANFVAFNMLQAKFHFNIVWFCVVQMDDNHVEQRRQWSTSDNI